MSKHIPLGDVQAGIDMSKDRGFRHLNDARALIKSGKLEGASILAMYGLEELGRILILKDRCKKALQKGNNFIKIKKNRRKDNFYNHPKKQKLAESVLPPNSLKIYEGAFSSDDFEGKDFDVDRLLDQDLKVVITFIDYCDGWQEPPPIDIEKLKNCIDEIEKAIQAR